MPWKKQNFQTRKVWAEGDVRGLRKLGYEAKYKKEGNGYQVYVGPKTKKPYKAKKVKRSSGGILGSFF
jgi:hypothetical protein